MNKQISKLSIAVLTVCVSVGAFGCGAFEGKTTKFDSYDKQEMIDTLGSDFGNPLYIFPEDTDAASEVSISGEIYTGLDQCNGYVLLSCTYEPEAYEAEIERLSNITFSLKHGDEMLVHDVLYDDISYRLPAYVADDGYMDVYEYALVDDAEYKIDYVLLCSPLKGRCEGLDDVMKIDMSAYEYSGDESERDERFSIYVWHFST